MNQQFMPPQPYGAPPPTQNYPPTSRPSPSLGAQGGFQTVSLGAPTTSPDPANTSYPQNSAHLNKYPPTPNLRPPPASQLPPGQLPNPVIQTGNNYSQQDTPQNGTASLHDLKNIDSINANTQQHNNLINTSAELNNSIGEHLSNSNSMPPRFVPGQEAKPSGQNNVINQNRMQQPQPANSNASFTQAPMQQAAMPPTSQPQIGKPPVSMGGQQMPPVSMGGQMPPVSMGGQMPPVSMGGQMPPVSMGGQQMPPVSMGGQQMPPVSMGKPQMPPVSMGGQMPPVSMGGPQMPPVSMGGQQMPPVSMGGQQMPPVSMGGQQMPPVSMGGQQMPPVSMGGQQMPPGKPSQLSSGQPTMIGGQQSQPNQPPMPSMFGQQPNLNNAGQPPKMSGQGPNMAGQPPNNLLQKQPNLGGQPPMSGQPPIMSGQPPNMTGQQPMPGHPPNMPGQPPNMSGLGGMAGQPPMMSNQPPMGGQSSMFGQPQQQQPLGGRPPMPGMPHMPPGGQQPPMNNMNRQPPMPGQQPPMPMSNQPRGGQPGYNQPDHLSNQLQNVSLTGPTPPPPTGPTRQYPPMMNGNNAPHKPPIGGGQQPHGMPPPPGPGGYPNQQQQPGQPMMQQQAGGYPPPPGGRMGGGMPPMPVAGGQQGQVAGGGYQQIGGGGGYAQPQQQQKKLDPDQMPSKIQVTEDDQTQRSGTFYLNQKGLVPPLVTSTFIAHDQGYASPRFIRSTMYNVPVSNDLMKQTSIPFGLVISPMARTASGEYPPPCVDFGQLGPVRCVRCKAYMCPYMQFIDSGRRFQCLFCRASTEVPAEYFQHLDHTGQRMDRLERPELVLGTYEFVATADYCRNNKFPKPPAFIFVIDVSYNNVKSGLVQLLCAEMKQVIKNLPVDQGQEKSTMRVGFITYNSSVHFYNIKGNLAAPQMLVVGDTQEMFMPLLDGFLCTPDESETVIDALMEQIPTMFGETRECETILLPAITAGLEALKASECTGKLLVFHSTLPTAEAPGKLKNRDERKLLGTDKERTVLTPQSTVYNQLGQDCVGAGCSVDLYLFNNAYIDIATIGQVARLSGGEVFKYTYFQADLDGTRLLNDIITNISRPIAFDSIMRVRTSTGIRPTDFYGHFFMSNTTDIELASIDCDKAIAVEVKHDDKLNEDDGIYIQIALLYTSCSGQRRLRIINQALKTCSQMADLYRSCDLDTIVNFFGKQAVWKLLENNPKAVKDNVVHRAAQILATYRKNCANPSSAGQLILPECMKLLPLYVNCVLKSDAVSGGADMTLDDRSFAMQAVMTMDIPSSVNYYYPRLLPIHDLQVQSDGTANIPRSVRCTVDKLADHGVYILENGIHMFVWIGLNVSQDFTLQVFGVPSAMQINVDTAEIPVLENSLSKAVHSVINGIRRERHRFMRLTLVRQREKLEPVFKHFLVEDRGNDGSASYVDFLCYMHKEIRTMLS